MALRLKKAASEVVEMSKLSKYSLLFSIVALQYKPTRAADFNLPPCYCSSFHITAFNRTRYILTTQMSIAALNLLHAAAKWRLFSYSLTASLAVFWLVLQPRCSLHMGECSLALFWLDSFHQAEVTLRQSITFLVSLPKLSFCDVVLLWSFDRVHKHLKQGASSLILRIRDWIQIACIKVSALSFAEGTWGPHSNQPHMTKEALHLHKSF